MSIFSNTHPNERNKLLEEAADRKVEAGRQEKEISYQRSTLDLFRERMRVLDREKILHGRKAVLYERFESIFSAIVKEYDFEDAQEAYRYLEKLKFAQQQLMEDLAHAEGHCLEEKTRVADTEKAREKELASLQKEFDSMSMEHRGAMDKRDVELEELRGDDRRHKSLLNRYEKLRDALNRCHS